MATPPALTSAASGEPPAAASTLASALATAESVPVAAAPDASSPSTSAAVDVSTSNPAAPSLASDASAAAASTTTSAAPVAVATSLASAAESTAEAAMAAASASGPPTPAMPIADPSIAAALAAVGFTLKPEKPAASNVVAIAPKPRPRPAVVAIAPAPASVVSSVTHYNRLDPSDLAEARALGLLREDMKICADASSADFGIAYEKKGGTKTAGCGTDVFASQKALQERCKDFAMQRGFQLIVAGSSTRAKGGGNVKYRCKKLHGQQFFDPSTPADKLQCPFYVNGYGKESSWKITRACFLHNHYKFIGWRSNTASNASSASVPFNSVPMQLPMVNPLMLPPNATLQQQQQLMQAAATAMAAANAKAKGSEADTTTAGAGAPRMRTQRNTTLSMKALCRMVMEEVNSLPSPAMAMVKLDGKLIRRILLGRGHTINHMMASRIKRQLQETRIAKVRSSFQKLGGYLKLVAEKNPGSLFRVETSEDTGGFKRALFIPSATLNAVKFCRKLVALDHITPSVEDADTPLGKLEDEENDDVICGVYLKATTKDFNDQPITFAVALVAKEDQENWEWFLKALQDSQAANWDEYTVMAGRTRGLQPALQAVWPKAAHHYCMRRVVEDELMLTKKIPLTPEKKQRIFDLARSDSEAEFNTLRKDMLRTNEAVVQYLDRLNRANWVKYAFLESFQRPTFNEVTADLAMARGSEELVTQTASATHKDWFGEDPVHTSQPLYTFNQYFMKIAENFHARRQAVKMRPQQELVPMRDAQLQQILQGSQRCESIPCANGVYMVRYLGPTRLQIQDAWRHVNLLDWECKCLDWQDQHFPCLHAIHAAELAQRRIDSLYDIKENSIENYLNCYGGGFTPWPTEGDAIESDNSLKTPLDLVYAEDSSSRRKPGPRPKARKTK